MSKMVRTRFAPSPTGDMHLGNLRTAIFSALFAAHNNGAFILRIDDTDDDRNKKEAVDLIHRILDWMHIRPAEVHYQSRRRDIYLEAAEKLVTLGAAVRLSNGAIAISVAEEQFLALAARNDGHISDMVLGKIPLTWDDFKRYKDQILVRGGEKLGQPTYQFASVVDDNQLGITHILRGQDHVPNTSRQMFIWESLRCLTGYNRDFPKVGHLSLLSLGGKKLSKRDDSSSVLKYLDSDICPEAMFNFLLKCGWSWAGDGPDIVTMEEAIEGFMSKGQLSPKSFAGVDFNKLKWFNKKWKTRLRNN